MYNDLILQFGYLAKIHHDQGKEIENHLFQELEKFCNIQHSRTAPYQPEVNGQKDCLNRTLLSILSTLPESAKSNWKDHLNKVFSAYNCTSDDGSGFSPPYLHFGCHQLLPIDMIFDRATGDNTSSHLQYVQEWKRTMSEAYRLAGKRSNERREKANTRRETHFQERDRILLRKLTPRVGPRKLRAN